MIEMIVFGLFVVYYAKPIYWVFRMVYLHFTDSNMTNHPTNAEEIQRYKENLNKWFSQTWALVKWYKEDA